MSETLNEPYQRTSYKKMLKPPALFFDKENRGI
jgi:hypothetical protein